MKHFFAYIRVSTAKQGERGVSLQEQRAAIERHANQHQLQIAEWFEERETAAKRGRPVFNQMLRLLNQGTAAGVIIHKIDRSARNLRDWADLGEMIDGGIEVHFANESLDLNSRGGRLSADIQAVVAADFIRNLQEESRKGFYGRIKQGLYPLPAPIGYLDKGRGNPKVPDPTSAPFVKHAFDLYATRQYTVRSLASEMYRVGLRNRGGHRVTKTGISAMLNNPFYIGLIRLRRTGEMFQGVHEPLVMKRTFDRVHDILTGKANTRTIRHDFLFRRILRCATCGLALIGERQKGHNYYRCHTPGCTTVREEVIEQAILDGLQPLVFSDDEKSFLSDAAARLKASWLHERENLTGTLTLRLTKMAERMERLADAYLDRVLDKEIFDKRKAALLMERKDVEESIASMTGPKAANPEHAQQFLELAKNAYLLYQTAIPEEKRDLVMTVTSNRRVVGKNVEITLAEPFRSIAERHNSSNGSPSWDIPRTISHLLVALVKFCSNVETRIKIKQ